MFQPSIKKIIGFSISVAIVILYWWAAVATSQATDYVTLNAYVDTLGLDSIVVTNNDSFDYEGWTITAVPSTQLDSSYYLPPNILSPGQTDTFHLNDMSNYWNSIYPDNTSPKSIRLSVSVPNTEVRTEGEFFREF